MEPSDSGCGSDSKTDGEKLPTAFRKKNRLFLAVRNGEMQVLKDLLNHPASLTSTDRRGDSALHIGVQCGKDECVVELLSRGADCNATNKYGNSPLHFAVEHGHLKIVQLLFKHGAKVDLRNHEGKTPLNSAMFFKANARIVAELLEHGADVHAIDNSNNNTPLHICITSSKDVQCVKELLRYGARVNALNSVGLSPLHQSVMCAAVVIKELLDHGANIDEVHPQTGCTTLHLAACFGSDELSVCELLRRGAQVNAICKKKETPLVKALLRRNRSTKVISDLLLHGADIFSVDVEERTPLRIAMRHSDSASAELLIKLYLFKKFDLSNLPNFDSFTGSKNYDFVTSYFDDCVSELTEMENIRVEGYTLYTLLSTEDTKTPLYSENQNTEIITQKEKLLINFPIYNDVISPWVNCALKRGMLLCKLGDAFVYCRKHSGKKIMLTDGCVSVIAKNLSNSDLQSLIVVFDNCKQKRESEELCHGTSSKKIRSQ